MNPYKEKIAKITNPRKVKGVLSNAMKGADLFIGLSKPNLIRADDIKKMSKEPVIFALSNPDPEIAPEAAMKLARIVATGRSDYPNQIIICLAIREYSEGFWMSEQWH